jgi:hypothetical protein
VNCCVADHMYCVHVHVYQCLIKRVLDPNEALILCHIFSLCEIERLLRASFEIASSGRSSKGYTLPRGTEGNIT